MWLLDASGRAPGRTGAPPALTCAVVVDLPARVVPRLIGGKGDGHCVALGFNPVRQRLPTKWAIFLLVCLNLKVERPLSPQHLPGQGEAAARGTRPSGSRRGTGSQGATPRQRTPRSPG